MISLGIIFFVLLMVTIATLLMGPQDPPFFGRRLQISDLYDQDFKPKPMGVQWMSGTNPVNGKIHGDVEFSR